MAATRDRFVQAFGEREAALIEAAADGHKNGEKDNPWRKLGEGFFGKQIKQAEDAFLLDLAWCISWECLWVDGYRTHHGLTVDKNVLREWVRENAVPPAEYRDPAGETKYAEYLGEVKGG